MKTTRRTESNLLAQQEVLERSLNLQFKNLKFIDKKYLDDLKTLQMKLNEERETEEKNFKKSLAVIAMGIKKLKSNLEDQNLMKNCDLEYIKNNLTGTEEKLTSFNDLVQKQMVQLEQEEDEFQEAINALTRRIQDAVRGGKPDTSPGANLRLHARPRVESTHAYQNMHPDIQEFQKFVQESGGHTGGWDTADHLLFVRLLQKHHSSEQLLLAVIDQLPDKKPEDISQHEVWYHKYLTLKESHRAVLKQWKKGQSRQRLQRVEMHIQQTTDAISYQPIHNRDPAIKDKIQEWKKRQEEKRQRDILELKEKKQKEEEIWRQKVAYIEKQNKLLSARYQKPEESPEQSKIAVPQQTNQQKVNSRISLKEFWEQDRLFVERKLSILQAHRSRSLKRNIKSAVQVERDPCRLLQPTAVWREKLRRSLSEENHKLSRSPLYIADVPHLGTPKWREGLF